MWKRKYYKPLTFPCFYCNADSDELKYFLLIFIGGLSIGAILLAIGFVLRGTFQQSEDLSDRPYRLQLQEDQLDQLDQLDQSDQLKNERK